MEDARMTRGSLEWRPRSGMLTHGARPHVPSPPPGEGPARMFRVETVGETNHLRNLAGQLLEHVRVTGTVRTRLWWAVAPRLAELPAAEQEAIRLAVGTAPFWP